MPLKTVNRLICTSAFSYDKCKAGALTLQPYSNQKSKIKGMFLLIRIVLRLA